MMLDRLFKKRVIHNCEHEPYLYRWYVIRTERFGLFIHKFVRSDEDRALHDHPWAFLVIPIWRGYIEHSDRPCGSCNGLGYYEWELLPKWRLVPCDECGGRQRIEREKRVRPFLGIRFRHSTYRHRVELLQQDRKPLPSWSIFIRFARAREWGFWTAVGFVHWKNWWDQNCE